MTIRLNTEIQRYKAKGLNYGRRWSSGISICHSRRPNFWISDPPVTPAENSNLLSAGSFPHLNRRNLTWFYVTSSFKLMVANPPHPVVTLHPYPLHSYFKYPVKKLGETNRDRSCYI